MMHDASLVVIRLSLEDKINHSLISPTRMLASTTAESAGIINNETRFSCYEPGGNKTPKAVRSISDNEGCQKSMMRTTRAPSILLFAVKS